MTQCQGRVTSVPIFRLAHSALKIADYSEDPSSAVLQSNYERLYLPISAKHPSPEREFNLTKALFASSWILIIYILNSHSTNFRWILLREIEVFAFFVFFEPIFTWIH